MDRSILTDPTHCVVYACGAVLTSLAAFFSMAAAFLKFTLLGGMVLLAAKLLKAGGPPAVPWNKWVW